MDNDRSTRRQSLPAANDSVTSSNLADVSVSGSGKFAGGSLSPADAAAAGGGTDGSGARRGSNFSNASFNEAQAFQFSNVFSSSSFPAGAGVSGSNSPARESTPMGQPGKGSGSGSGSRRRGSTSFVEGNVEEQQQQQQQQQQHPRSKSVSPTSQQQQQLNRREQQTLDIATYFQQLKDLVPPIADKDTQQQHSSSSFGRNNIDSSEPIASDAHKNSIRELLYHHACVVEALSAQLPVDVELSPSALRSTAQNCADAARMRVDFLTDTKSALVAMRVMSHLAILGGQRWRERQRTVELRRADDEIAALRGEVSGLKQQLNDAHREIGALQSVVNETRMTAHRQLMDSEMKRRELQDELGKHAKHSLMQRSMLASQQQQQHQQQQQPQSGATPGGGIARRRRSLMNASINNDAFGEFESSMVEPPDFMNSSITGGGGQQQQQQPPPLLTKAASLSGIRDAWGGALSQKQQKEATPAQKQQQQQDRSSGNSNYGAARRLDGSDMMMLSSLDGSNSKGNSDSSSMAMMTTTNNNPARWLANQQSDERTAAIRRRASGAGVSFEERLQQASDPDGTVHFGPSGSESSYVGSPSFGPGSPGHNNTTRRRSAVSFANKGRGGGQQQQQQQQAPGSPRPLSAGRNKQFLTGVKDMLQTLIPERQKVGFAEEDALADLEEAEIIHGHVSDITGEPPSSDLKVVRNFSASGGGGGGSGGGTLKDVRERQRLERKRKMFGAGSADAVVPPILFKRPPQVPDSEFVETVFRGLQSLQVGSFHGNTDDRSDQAVVEPEQVVEYLNTHWPELEDLLRETTIMAAKGGAAASSDQQQQRSAVVDFVNQHRPLHLRSFASVLLHVCRL